MARGIALALALACAQQGVALQAAAQEAGPKPFDKPQGVYATIDIPRMEQQVRALAQLIPGPRREAIAAAVGSITKMRPPVLYALANAVAQDDKNIAEAVFWYHVARIRAVYDALRCKDPTAREVINGLGKGLSPDISRYQRQRRQHTLEIAQLALKWDKENARDYDHRWINMYGKVARTSDGGDPSELTVPESEWPAILERVHAAHLKSVQEFAAAK